MSYHESKSPILSTLFIEEGRQDIYDWGEKRRSTRKGLRGWIYSFKKMFIDKSILRSFINNLTVVLALQMVLSGLFTYMCQHLDMFLDVDIALFISPIIFPLAFSINADFQRREKVLEDLALFKGALVVLFFCHRDWKAASGLSQDFLKAVTNKLKGLILNIKEYLLTEKESRRHFILSVIYEDFSDISQMNDRVRASGLPSNSPLVTRLIHYHNLMFWAFERLRVVREYRSPRTIRSFTKVFIFLMPLVLSPYYVYIGKSSQNFWGPYYIALMTSFVFGTLQGVQDVLDDPFDGISEDDINLGHLEDWTSQSLLTNRTYTVGRFTVTTSLPAKESDNKLSPTESTKGELERSSSFRSKPILPKRSILRRGSQHPPPKIPECNEKDMDILYPEMASRVHSMQKKGLTGSTTILRGNQLKDYNYSADDNLNGSVHLKAPRSAVDIKRSASDITNARSRRRAFKKSVSFSMDCDAESSTASSNDEQDTTNSHCSSRTNDEAPLLGSDHSRIEAEYWNYGDQSQPLTPDDPDVPESLRDVFHELESASSTNRIAGAAGKPAMPCSLASIFDQDDTSRGSTSRESTSRDSTSRDSTSRDSTSRDSTSRDSTSRSSTRKPVSSASSSLQGSFEPADSGAVTGSGKEREDLRSSSPRFQVSSSVEPENSVRGHKNEAYRSSFHHDDGHDKQPPDKTSVTDTSKEAHTVPQTDRQSTVPLASGTSRFNVKPMHASGNDVSTLQQTSRDHMDTCGITTPAGETAGKTSTVEPSSQVNRRSRFSVTRTSPLDLAQHRDSGEDEKLGKQDKPVNVPDQHVRQDSFWDFTDSGSLPRDCGDADQQRDSEERAHNVLCKKDSKVLEILNSSEDLVGEVYI